MRDCPADRISNLPQDVINGILKHLPLRDAVRTSLLSRGWRYKWVTIPCLDFDEDFVECLKVNDELESTVDRILVLHKGDIVKFSLVNCPIEDRLAINRWLLFLSDHRIKDLVLSFTDMGYDPYPAMPIHLLAFNQLTHLNLGLCEVRLTPEFGGFSRLCRLDLVDVDIECADLEMWLSRCPMLEYFYMRGFRGYLCLDIDAPSLKVFHFQGSLESICFKNTKPKEISIGCDGYELDTGLEGDKYIELPYYRGSESNLYKVLGHLGSLEKLNLDCSVLLYLAGRGLPRILSSKFNHLTVLEFSSFGFGSMIDVACALCFIRSSPNLQGLKLTSSIRRYFTGDDVAQYLKKEQQRCDFIHSRLRYVQMRRNSNVQYEMEFVKLLLQWATTLEILEIKSKYRKHTDKREGFKMLKEITSFHRASYRAAIIFD